MYTIYEKVPGKPSTLVAETADITYAAKLAALNPHRLITHSTWGFGYVQPAARNAVFFAGSNSVGTDGALPTDAWMLMEGHYVTH